MRRALAVLLSLALLVPGCATARSLNSRLNYQPNASAPDRALLITYLKQLPIGSRVRASLIGGQTVRGTLMKAADEGIVVQRRTRIPEPPTDIAIEKIGAVEIDTPGGVGKAVGIGVASGAGAALGVFLLLVAILAGD
jgi:hypothetical protein